MSSLFSQDKLLHFFVCLDIVLGVFVLTSGLFSWWFSALLGVGVAALVALGKEWFNWLG